MQCRKTEMERPPVPLTLDGREQTQARNLVAPAVYHAGILNVNGLVARRRLHGRSR